MTNKWYSVFKAVLGPALTVWNRPTINGADNVPDSGAALLVSNHQAVMDSFYLPLMLRRQLVFPAKSEYFTTPGIKGAIQKWFFTSVGQVPLDRNSADAGTALQNAAERVLDGGELFGIYPEGTRSPDGRIYKGRTGVARIAMTTGVPVVLTGMIGTRNANPIGTNIPRPAKVHIEVSEPIDPHAWAVEHGFDPASRDVARPFTDYLMHRLAELTGYEYVDVYATEVKEALEATGQYPPGAEPKTPSEPNEGAGK